MDETASFLRFSNRRYVELKKQLSGETPLMDSSEHQPANLTKLKQYQEQLDTMLSQYTEQHPDVKLLRTMIAELKIGKDNAETSVPDERAKVSVAGAGAIIEFNPVYQELKVEMSKAKVELEILKVQLSDKTNVMKRLKKDIDVIPEVEAKLSKLNRDYAVTRERYLNLVERRESARLAQDAGQSSSDITFRVIEPPITPITPAGPPRVLYLVASLFAALGAGLGWSFVRFMLAPTFFDLKQVTEKIGLPVLGTVSLYLSPKHKRKRKLQLASFLSATSLLVIVFAGVVVLNEVGSVLVGSIKSDLTQKMKER